ncbi:Two-component system response regulatory protein, LuxR family [Flavobacterium branchiophilum]|uniref:Two-component system response regulatory protein, LuxR family n=1 Tax=Flavobacterium branchiophilum (strain FL-15) TaxID=1034807 RepID=G2Z6F0_FLABF|nr:response regulator transcription factor [Flavobacterium branchiophilum]CCB70972.1 Two-component system response regulatory protein, LuxR family [Flavobacterium branchiophilum FL-15]
MNIRIGLVDDHQMFLDGMVSVLSQKSNFEIVFAVNNAQLALNKIALDLPDIIITDISMPNMNGIEFIKALKNKHVGIKILVVSMFGNLQTYEDIDGYLLKETEKDKLITAIEDIVHRNQKVFWHIEKKTNSFEFNKNILSPREKEIIKLIAQELTTEEIANRLNSSKHTIETHRKNIFVKLQIKSTAGLILKALQLGVLPSI